MQRQRTLHEEIANSVTHAIGLLASFVGVAVLLGGAFRTRSGWHLTATAVYGTSLVLVYLASTLYHTFQRPRMKRIFRLLDHCAIYLLIAGTCTPFLLVGLRGGFGYAFLAVVWLLAAAGVVFKVVYLGRFPRYSTLTYLLMGWLGVLILKPLLVVLSGAGVAWLLLGGLAYTLGTVFYHAERLPYAHAVWHLFVLTGSICHYIAVAMHLLAPAA